MPEDHLTLSRGKIGLVLVKGKVFLGEQSFQPSDLALVPLGSSALLLGHLGKVADPLLQGSNLFPGFPSLGHEIRAFLPKLGRNLALLHELPLSRLPRKPSRRCRPPRRLAPHGGTSISPRMRLGAPTKLGVM